MNQIGYVAVCSRGLTGLVLSVDSLDGETIIYCGICLEPGKVGNKWESRDPSWVGTLDEWVILRAMLLEANEKE